MELIPNEAGHVLNATTVRRGLTRDGVRGGRRRAGGTGEAEWRGWIRGLGVVVRRARELSGLTQSALGRLAGISQGGVSRLEAGQATSTPIRSIIGVLAALGDSLTTIPPDAIPDDVHWLLNVRQLSPWSPPPDTGRAAGDPSLRALVEAYLSVTPHERPQFVRVALSLANAFGTAPGAATPVPPPSRRPSRSTTPTGS